MAIQKIPRLQACIILFNSKKKARSYEELYERKLNEIKFVEILENCIGLDKKIVGGGMNNETTLFYYYHGPNYKSSSLEVDIYGEEGLLEMIILAQKERWQRFD